MSRSLSVSDMLAFYRFCPVYALLHLIGKDDGVVLAAFFEICGEPFAILVRHLVNIHAEKPLLLAILTGALGRNYYDDSFYRSLRQIEADEQESTDSGQVGFGESSAGEGKHHPELADRFAMTSRWLGI